MLYNMTLDPARFCLLRERIMYYESMGWSDTAPLKALRDIGAPWGHKHGDEIKITVAWHKRDFLTVLPEMRNQSDTR